MKGSKRWIIAVSLWAGILLAAAPAVASRSNYVFEPARISTLSCGATSWDLVADQDIDIGSVTVRNDSRYLYVSFDVGRPDVTLGALHVWVGNSLLNLPAKADGSPNPSRFCEADGGACADGSGRTRYTFKLSFADLSIVDDPHVCGSAPYVVAHADVNVDGNRDGIRESRSAYAGDLTGAGPRPWSFAEYALCCDLGAPKPPACDSAFAKGGWVWATDRKSNPERLPSLGLSQNGWGWAIQLTDVGKTHHDLWIGAKRNETAKGRLVGSVDVFWTGTSAFVTYSLFPGLSLEQIQVYSGDAPPTVLGPGQYGYALEFDPNTDEYSLVVPLVDEDGVDGVWLVASAAICD